MANTQKEMADAQKEVVRLQKEMTDRQMEKEKNEQLVELIQSKIDSSSMTDIREILERLKQGSE